MEIEEEYIKQIEISQSEILKKFDISHNRHSKIDAKLRINSDNIFTLYVIISNKTKKNGN